MAGGILCQVRKDFQLPVWPQPTDVAGAGTHTATVVSAQFNFRLAEVGSRCEREFIASAFGRVKKQMFRVPANAARLAVQNGESPPSCVTYI